MIKIDHHAITAALENILRRLGIGPAEFQLPAPPPRPDMDFNKDADGLSALMRLFHEESGLLIRNGRPVFVYIPDHVTAYKLREKYNRVHFTVCQTLKEMEGKGRLKSRYRATERDDNLYRIDIGGRKEKETKLLPCQHCLFESRYPGFPDFMSRGNTQERGEAANRFDAKEAFKFLRRCFEEFHSVADVLQSAAISTDYPRNWGGISRKIREERNYTCDECGVCLKEHPSLVDVHHDDENKANVERENLQVLCKEHHAQKHPHYRISESVLRIIQEARRAQGISP